MRHFEKATFQHSRDATLGLQMPNPALYVAAQRQAFTAKSPDLRRSLFWGIRSPIPLWLNQTLMLTGAAAPLALWLIVVLFMGHGSLFLPTPMGILHAGARLWDSGLLASDVLASSSRVCGGFLLAALIGIPLGLLCGTFRTMESLFTPLVGTIRYMPVTAFVPLVIMWVGIGEL